VHALDRALVFVLTPIWLLAFALSTLIFGLPPFVRADRRLGELADATLVARVLRPSRWKVLGGAAAALAPQVGTLFLVAVGQPEQAAIFAVALGVALLFRSAFAWLEKSLRGRVARVHRDMSTGRVVKGTLSWVVTSLGLALLGLPAIVSFGWWLPQFLPETYGALSVPLWLTAAAAEIRKASNRESHLVLTLTEGRNREVRRMLAAAGHPVTRLRRVEYGGLELGTLAPGAWREVTAVELRRAFPGRPHTRKRAPSPK